MRHQKSGRKLHRPTGHREAMLRNMTVSLLRHEQIRTTVPKAKELRRVAERLITLAKTASLANRRLAFSRLRDREMVGKLFADLGVRFKERPGGYLRILKCGPRRGDNAPLAIVQLVDRTPAPAPEGAGTGAAADKAPSKERKEKSPKATKTARAAKAKAKTAKAAKTTAAKKPKTAAKSAATAKKRAKKKADKE